MRNGAVAQMVESEQARMALACFTIHRALEVAGSSPAGSAHHKGTTHG